MSIKKFIELVKFMEAHDLNQYDLMVLHDVATMPADATIMNIVNSKYTTASVSTKQTYIKKLYTRGFLKKKEASAKDMRKKTLELSDSAIEFIKQFEEIGA